MRQYDPADRRRRYLANREREIETARAWQIANPDRVRDLKREDGRRRYATDPAGTAEHFRRMKMAWRHGMHPEDWAAMWTSQRGCCYLCGDEMSIERAHLDHDHRCCPKGFSCQYCRRGLACPGCNQLIGMASDDPAKLRRIAANLEAVLASVHQRMAAKPVQEQISEAAAEVERALAAQDAISKAKAASA